jgi:hypothetical protein
MPRPFKDDMTELHKSYVIDPVTGCWEWSRSRHKSGYGKVSYRGKLIGAHRMSYQLYNGPIPDDIDVCHDCDNRPCVNPEHLFTGTAKDNGQDMSRKGRSPLQKLSDVEVLAIRKAYEDGVPRKEIASAYGIGTTQVWRIGTMRQRAP